MEDLNNNEYDEVSNNNELRLPISQDSGSSFQKLLKINQIYVNQLLNIISSSSKELKRKKFIFPYNDMKVLNSLIKEDFTYLFQ
jgi:hypothetical protein